MARLKIIVWSFVFKSWLKDGRRVVRVKGWRTAVVEGNMERRQTITPCFKILGVEFD